VKIVAETISKDNAVIAYDKTGQGAVVQIVPYDHNWPRLFNQLGTGLRTVLGNMALRIDHIGSTSIPDLDAKPIIDIQVSVVSFEPLNAFRLPLEHLGYVFRAENPDLTKRYFRESSGERRTHIHVRRWGSWSEQQTLLFRDYMRAHRHDAIRYARLKYALAAMYKDDRVGYSAAKSPFIWEIMAKADRWSQEVGWEAVPTDI
jgi:GrpB-like predicted nucleotidyltransferase (UPF0157 family)